MTQPLAEALAASAALAATDVQAEAAEVLLGQAKGSAAPHHLYALDALVRSGGALPGVAAAAPAFAKSEDARIRIAGLALQAAADVERSASLVTLIDLAAKGSTDDAAAAGVELRALPAPIAAAGLDDAMRATDPTVRARAAGLAMATVFLAREAKLTSLLEAARDADERVREAAVAALGRCLPAGKPFFRNRAEQIAPTLAALGGDTSKAVLAALGNTRKVLGLG
ncbi:MAG: hypothetical protein R3B72_38900 [Polyangiaceae bacterium]